jgi:hypothetical protein
MSIRAFFLTLLLACNTAAHAECESSPKPIDEERSVSPATLVLKARGTYYLIDPCATISRSQFGPIITLGYLNNFAPSTFPTFFSVKVKRTLASDHRPFLSLVRSPGWYLALSSQTDLQELPEIRGDPYKGTLAQWNAAYIKATTPDDLRALAGLSRPWHAYVDIQKSIASTDDVEFWKIDGSNLKPNQVITSYLIRFTPSQSFILLPFDVYIQQGVDKVELITASPIDALAQTRTFLIVP